MYKFYQYEKCSTCRKAGQFLDAHGIAYRSFSIRETPPTREEIRRMATFQKGELKKLFNVSGGEYRALGLKSKLHLLTTGQQIDLLARNGNLVKRPFLIGKDLGLVGFREEEWKQALA